MGEVRWRRERMGEVRWRRERERHSIVYSMACNVELKNKFLYNWKITLL